MKIKTCLCPKWTHLSKKILKTFLENVILVQIDNCEEEVMKDFLDD